MFRNYIKIAFRNIIKHKGFSFINILGLAVGIACCILIFLFVQDELSYDTFHDNGEDLYIIALITDYGSRTSISAGSPTGFGPIFKRTFPEIVDFARFANGLSSYTLKYGDAIFTERIKIADPSVLTMFTFPMVKGNPATALSDPYSVVMTERMAEKYFGNENPIGKTVTVNNKYDFTVTGVMKEIPHNSTLQFDFLFPILFLKEDWNLNLNALTNFAFTTYFQLQKNTDYETVGNKITEWIKQQYPSANIELFLRPYTELHLYWLGYGGGRIEQITIFIIIGAIILLVACINFMNLTTSRSANRSKEIGLRKVAGAQKGDIIKQFYGESIIFSFISLFFAIILTMLFLPAFNNLTVKQLTLNFTENPVLVPGLFCITIITGIIAGFYPALLMSSFRPVKILKGSIATGSKSSRFRKTLVIIQFAASITFIIATMVVYKQLNFLNTRDLGFNKEHLVYIPLNETLKRQHETVKLEMLQNPNILYASFTSHSPRMFNSSDNWDWEGRDPAINPAVWRFSADADFLKTFKTEMALGEYYSEESGSGASDQIGKIIINEEFAKVIERRNPVGMRLSMDSNYYTVLGVIKDFNFMPLHRRIEPMIVAHKSENGAKNATRFRYLFLKIQSDNISEANDHIEMVYKKFCPEFPFELRFLDEDFEQLYNDEQRTGTIMQYFAVLLIFISCLGLFGLASYMAEQRTKEIGIRKALGSSVSGITILLSKEFIKWILIANLIAFPVSWFLLENWLQNYAYRTNIGWVTFILSGILALIIAIITVGFQVIRAARANPVDSLRYE